MPAPRDVIIQRVHYPSPPLPVDYLVITANIQWHEIRHESVPSYRKSIERDVSPLADHSSSVILEGSVNEPVAHISPVEEYTPLVLIPDGIDDDSELKMFAW